MKAYELESKSTETDSGWELISIHDTMESAERAAAIRQLQNYRIVERDQTLRRLMQMIGYRV